MPARVPAPSSRPPRWLSLLFIALICVTTVPADAQGHGPTIAQRGDALDDWIAAAIQPDLHDAVTAAMPDDLP
ncbi:MAG TPA: hypothetical protein VD767_08515, partial [Thermomicrobiales bacterium]|nr:hypothetical protein [Thermomicrobiales bacterium]